jgi:hypothetical protein
MVMYWVIIIILLIFISKKYHSIQVLDLKKKSFQENYHKKPN